MRTTRTDHPVRRTSPIINPSRGPGPNCEPMGIQAALVSAVHERLPAWRFIEPAGGLALWCELPQPLSSALTTAAERQHVLLASGPSFAPEGGLERYIRLPYTRPAEVLDEAVTRLAVAWEDAKRHRTVNAARSPLVA